MREIHPVRRSAVVQEVHHEGLRQYMMSVFMHMGLGLLLTAIVSYAVASSPELMRVIFGTPLYYVFILAPIGIAFYFSYKIAEISYETARAFFYIYSFLLGVSLSALFLQYRYESIAQTFLITSATFGSMSLYGYTTRSDLTSMGSFLTMGLFGIIIAMVVNLFLQSSALSLAVSAIAVLVFTGLTAYDVQTIKAIYDAHDDIESSSKKALFGAFRLYLDFINLFIHLLQFMGRRR